MLSETQTERKREKERESEREGLVFWWCFVQNVVKGVKGFKFWFGCNGHECGWFGTEARVV